MDNQKHEKMKQEMRKEMQDLILGIKLGKLVIETESPELGEVYLDVLAEEIQKMRSPALAAQAGKEDRHG